MGRLFLALTALLLIGAIACTDSSSTSQPTQATNTTPTAITQATATLAPLPTDTPIVVGGEASLLEVLSPDDESVVTEAELVVVGITLPDAVVTVNDIEAEVDEDGEFFAAITLVEGPNTIEIIASDFAGNEASTVLTVIYLP
ncbi:MAG: hypothetical protein O2854_05560 [Chloroflexi bacterium]|nr:hypothetical protein [Chloroflexota bacterium]